MRDDVPSMKRLLFLVSLHAAAEPLCDQTAAEIWGRPLKHLGPMPGPMRALLSSIVEEPQIFRATVPETASVVASRVELRGQFFPARIELNADGTAATLSPRSDQTFHRWGGEDFVEATNPSAFTLETPGGSQEFMLPRAVLPYRNTLRPADGVLNGPSGYYSHIPILRREGDAWKFEDFLVKSDPEKKYFFEDPRFAGPLVDSKGKEHYFLGGTDYSRHVEGQEDLFVRNVMYPLDFEGGRLKPLAIDPATGKPKDAFFVSPSPKKMPQGWRGVDAKNGVITQLDDGSIVVHTRFRVEPGDDPVYKALKEEYGERVPTWKYSIQAFKFKNYEDFRAYDWEHSMDDLLGQELGLAAKTPVGRVVPQTKIVLKDDQVKDFIPEHLRVPGKPLGMGNGARRVRLSREDDKIFASFHKNSPPHYMGDVPAELRAPGKFALAQGEVSYLAPDHQLGYFQDLKPGTSESRGVKRVYSGMMSLYDKDAMNLKAVYANVIQPLRPHQVSGTGGILDLNHAAYFMGNTLVRDPNNAGRHVMRAYAGAADAHAESFDFDLVKLLSEMSPGSAQRRSGQVYRP
jgi:hypothetical protein